MSVLTIVQGVCARLSFAQPTAVISSVDPQIQLMAALLQDVGDEITDRWDWQELKSPTLPALFTGDGTTTVFTLPIDFKDFLGNEFFFSSAYGGQPLKGPMKDEIFVQAKANGITLQPSMWRRVGRQIEFFPALQNLEKVTYAYVSRYWLLDVNGVTRKQNIGFDGDTAIIPERLLRQGVLWRYKRAKGLDFAQEFDLYETTFTLLKGQQMDERIINMSDEDIVDIGDTYLAQLITVS